MHKKFLLFLLLSLTALQVFACDVCSIFSSIEPNSFNSRIGITYRSSYYLGKPVVGLKHGGFKELLVKEIYDYYDISGRYYHKKSRFAIQGVLPIVNRYRSVDGVTESDNWGFGDPKLQVLYRAINSKKTDDPKKPIHRLDIGIGVKMPLGLTNRSTNHVISDIDMQPGTGSWDVLASLQYVVKIDKWGFIADFNYQQNNKGRTGYRYGDNLSLKTKGFFMWKKKDWTLLPSLGLGVDLAMEDRDEDQFYYDSGAMVFGADIGMNIYWKKIQLNSSFGVPMVQYFKGYESPLKYRFSIGLVYNF